MLFYKLLICSGHRVNIIYDQYMYNTPNGWSYHFFYSFSLIGAPWLSLSSRKHQLGIFWDLKNIWEVFKETSQENSPIITSFCDNGVHWNLFIVDRENLENSGQPTQLYVYKIYIYDRVCHQGFIRNHIYIHIGWAHIWPNTVMYDLIHNHI